MALIPRTDQASTITPPPREKVTVYFTVSGSREQGDIIELNYSFFGRDEKGNPKWGLYIYQILKTGAKTQNWSLAKDLGDLITPQNSNIRCVFGEIIAFDDQTNGIIVRIYSSQEIAAGFLVELKEEL